MSFVEFDRREGVCAVAMTISLSVGDGGRWLVKSLRETEICEGGCAAYVLEGLTLSRIGGEW